MKPLTLILFTTLSLTSFGANLKRTASTVEASQDHLITFESGRQKAELFCPNKLLIDYIKSLRCRELIGVFPHDNGAIKLNMTQCSYSESLNEYVTIQPSAGCAITKR